RGYGWRRRGGCNDYGNANGRKDARTWSASPYGKQLGRLRLSVPVPRQAASGRGPIWPMWLIVQSIRLGDGPDVAGQYQLHGQDALPLGVADADIEAVVAHPGVLGGRAKVAVEKIEQFGQSRRLGRAQLLRQRGQRAVAHEDCAV